MDVDHTKTGLLFAASVDWSVFPLVSCVPFDNDVVLTFEDVFDTAVAAATALTVNWLQEGTIADIIGNEEEVVAGTIGGVGTSS